jgi:FYVE, RhoGEF and PH domain containing 5/6
MKYRTILRIAVPDKPSAMIDFPSSATQSHVEPQPPLPQHLPFRRISFPTSAHHPPRRPLSAVSTASFDSADTSFPPPSFPSPSKGSPRGPRQRLISGEPNRRHSRRREVKSIIIDEQRDAKRRRIINEFYETERTYVEGLELIYSVRTPGLFKNTFGLFYLFAAFPYTYHCILGHSSTVARS